MGRTISGWLKDQDPDVWHATVDYLNWDNSFRILKWLVAHPQCDKATVAKIFWLADPGFYACEIAHGKGAPSWSESWPLVETILERWRCNFYQRSEIAWPDDQGRACLNSYRSAVSRVVGADCALDIPPGLFGPFAGRLPRVPPDLTPQENADLWDMLVKQGTYAGPRPGSDRWTADRQQATAGRRTFWRKLFG